MADETKPTAPTVETKLAPDASISYDTTTKATTTKDGSGGVVVKDGAAAPAAPATTDVTEAATKPDGEAEATPETPAEPELPAFDEAKPEVLQAYDAKYAPEGKLSMNALGGEFWANVGKAPDDPNAGLNEETYRYLEQSFGLTKETVKQVEKGLRAAADLEVTAFNERVGGKERYEAALEWGRTNYTPEQRTRFNALRDKGGPDFEDAVDALMARFGKATGNVGAAPAQVANPNAPPRRRSTPERSVTQNAPAVPAGPTPYVSYEEYQREFRAASNANGRGKPDNDKLAEVRARYAASPFARR